MYCAIIGDIIDSKQIIDRNAFQDSLKQRLIQINEDSENDVASNFLMTLGDEFQGLLNTPHKLISIITMIKAVTYPARVRIGIGIGSISTEIDKNLALGADGPAYHYSRACLEQIKRNERSYEQPEQEIMIKSDLLPEYFDRTVNSIFSLCTLIEKRWSDNQREKVSLITIIGNQREAAKKLGISQPSLYKGLRTAGYNTYMSALDTIQLSLSDAWEKHQ